MPNHTRKIIHSTSVLIIGSFLSFDAYAQAGGGGSGKAVPDGSGSFYQRDDVCKAFDDGGLTAYPCVKYVTGHNGGQGFAFKQYAMAAIPMSIDPQKHPQMTFTAWVKRGASGASGGAIISGGNSGGMPHLAIYGQHLLIKGGRTTYRQQDALGPIPRQEWTFIAGVYDYDAKTLRMHQGDKSVSFSGTQMDLTNSQQVRQDVKTYAAPDESEKKEYVFIGANSFGYGGPPKDIEIDDVRIFYTALSEAEVNTVRNSGAVGDGLDDAIINAISGGAPNTGNNPGSSPFPVSQAPTDSPSDRIGQSDPGVLGGVTGKENKDATGAGNGSANQPANTPPAGTTSSTASQQKSPYPSGPQKFSGLSGHLGDETRTIELANDFAIGFDLFEKRNKPCGVEVDALNGGANVSHEFIEDCAALSFGAFTPRSSKSVRLDFGSAIGSLEVCTNPNSKRVKGLRIYGDHINADGSTTYKPNTSKAESANCSQWHKAVLCPTDTLGTGLVIHSIGESISGLQLVCRAISVH